MTPLRIERLAPGDLLPAADSISITQTALALFASASLDIAAVRPQWGDAAGDAQPAAVAHDMLMAHLGRLLTRWVDQRRIRQYSARFVAAAHVGDVVACAGRVAEIFDHDGEARARLELASIDQDANVKLAGEAVIALD